MRTVGSWRSAPGRGRSRPPSGGRCSIAIGPVASRVAGSAPGRGITCITGRRAGRRCCRISSCCAGATTARFTRRAIASRARRTGRCGSPDPTGARCPTSRRLPRCPRTRPLRSRDVTPPMAFGSTHTRRAPPGSASASTWAGRSTCYIRSRRRALGQPPPGLLLHLSKWARLARDRGKEDVHEMRAARRWAWPRWWRCPPLTLPATSPSGRSGDLLGRLHRVDEAAPAFPR